MQTFYNTNIYNFFFYITFFSKFENCDSKSNDWSVEIIQLYPMNYNDIFFCNIEKVVHSWLTVLSTSVATCHENKNI